MELTRAFWSTILQIRVPEIKIFYLPEFEPSTNACEAANLPLLHSGGLCLYLLVPWLMEPGGSMPYLQGLFNEPQSCAESIQFLIYLVLALCSFGLNAEKSIRRSRKNALVLALALCSFG